MKKQTRSILQELNHLSLTRDNDRLIESTADNIIKSAANLLERISLHYDADTASELERRFINSIKSGDPKKFSRSINKIIETKERSNDY